jgi:hypothetical protein
LRRSCAFCARERTSFALVVLAIMTARPTAMIKSPFAPKAGHCAARGGSFCVKKRRTPLARQPWLLVAEVCAQMERRLESCPHCMSVCDSLERALSLFHADGPATPIPAAA